MVNKQKFKYCGVVEDQSWFDALDAIKGKHIILTVFDKVHQEKICGHKIRYKSLSSAKNSFKKLKKKKIVLNTPDAYICPFCLGWHIGH